MLDMLRQQQEIAPNVTGCMYVGVLLPASLFCHAPCQVCTEESPAGRCKPVHLGPSRAHFLFSSSFSRLGLPASSLSPSSRSSLGTTYLAQVRPRHASACCCRVTRRWKADLSQKMLRVPAYRCNMYQAMLRQMTYVTCVCTVSVP